MKHRFQQSAAALSAAAVTTAAAAEIVAVAARAWVRVNDIIISGKTAVLIAAQGKVEEFFSVSVLTGTILATATPLKALIAGKLTTVSADTNVTLTNGINVVYLKNDGTFSVTATFPTISRKEPAAPAANDHWYDLTSGGVMYKYSGSAWVATPEIPVACAICKSGAVVTGMYYSLPTGITMQEIYKQTGEPTVADTLTDGATLSINAATCYRSAFFINVATLNHDAENFAGSQELRAQWGIGFDGTSLMNLVGKGGRKATAGTGAGGAPGADGYGNTVGQLVGSGGGGGGSSTAAGGPSQGVQRSRSGLPKGAAGGGVNSNGADGLAVPNGTGMRFQGIIPAFAGYGLGGGAGAGDGTAGGDSGAGGGCLPLISPTILTASGAILKTDGDAGSTPAAGNRGGGSGGSAGLLYAYARNYIDRGATWQANGGAYGNGTGTGGRGGTGANGLIKQEKW